MIILPAGMKRLLLCLFLGIRASFAYCEQEMDGLLNELNKAINESPQYDSKKLGAIESLRQTLHEINPDQLTARFDIYLKLYEEYKVFNYDSAFVYTGKLQEMAYRLQDLSRIASAKLKMAFILISAGMFKETFDSLKTIHVAGLPDSIQAEYYALMGRAYYDLSDFDNNSHYSPAYVEQGNQYMDSALRLYPQGSYHYYYFSGLKNVKKGDIKNSLSNFQEIIHRTDLTDHQMAVAASTLSDIYIRNGETDRAIVLLIRAAIADLRSSTKETSAIFNLAGLLFKKGDLKNASVYIERAISDASFYGARQRKVQVSAILPLIEGEKVNRVESQKKLLFTYSAIVTSLLIALIVLAIIIYRQFGKLKTAKKIITEAHLKQQEINYKLSEANKIKEEYIGYFFNADSELFSKIEKLKRSLEQKINDRKFEELRLLVNNFNPKREKDELLKNFDRIFLKLFPNFVAVFNSLFKEEDQVKLKDNELLNTDLRIFALMRMGIHENEKIAQILEYSVNTIYAYKTKIKNRSLVPNEEFEDRIMDIKTL